MTKARFQKDVEIALANIGSITITKMRTEKEIQERLKDLEEQLPKATKTYKNKLQMKIELFKWILGQIE